MSVAGRASLRDVLKVDCLRGTTVLAGEAGLERMVSRLNVMEVPDVIDWVKPHELLVTSGYPLMRIAAETEDQLAAFVQLIRDLDEHQVVALGIKVGRYLDRVPDDVLAVANELDFPILQLRSDIAFDDLLQQVHGRLYDAQASVLERIDALHEVLARLVLEGGDLQQIADEVARVLSVGVLFTSTDGRIQAETTTPEMREALAEADLFATGGRFRVERANGVPLSVGAGQVRLQPVVAAGSELARLICFNPMGKIPFDDIYALERAATVAALLIARQQAVSAVESKYRGDFLHDVFEGRIRDPEHVLEHAASLDWDFRLPGFVVSARLDPPELAGGLVPSRVKREWQGRFFAAWSQVIRAHGKLIPTAAFSGEIVTLLPAPEGFTDLDDAAQDGIRSTLTQIQAAVSGDRGGGRRPFTVGVSRVAWSLEDVPDAYAQAGKAIEVGRRVNGGGSLTYFDDLGIHRLIGLVPDQQELRAFAQEVLGELARDTDEANELCTTLQVLLDSNLNVAEASRAQFFHYNTMRYRIGKLERILGPFTTDPSLRLNIAVALQVRQMQG